MNDLLSSAHSWSINNPNFLCSRRTDERAFTEGSSGVVELKVPMNRFSRSHFSFDVNRDITVGQLVSKIYNFYNAHELSSADLNNVEDDCIGYKADGERRLLAGEKVYPIDLMGHNIHFEGIRITGNTAVLCLGS